MHSTSSTEKTASRVSPSSPNSSFLEKGLDDGFSGAVEVNPTGGDVEKDVIEDIAPFEEYPEGGLQAWATVLGAFLIQVSGFGYTASFGVYEDYYSQIYLTNVSSSAISWIGSINACMTVMAGLLAGKLFDAGYFYFLLFGGAICSHFASLCFHWQNRTISISQGLGTGIAAGMTYVPTYAIVSHYFQRRRAFAMMIVASGSSLGAIVHPIMLNNLLKRIGFANTVRANAGLISAMLLIACLLMRTRLPPNKAPLGLMDAFLKFGKDKSYVLATIGMTIFSTGYYFPLFYLQLDAALHGLEPTFVFYTLVILNGCSLIGRLSPGLLVHRLGVSNMLIFGMFAFSITTFGMIGLGKGSGGAEAAPFVVIAILLGFFAGTYISLASPLVAAFAEDQSELGARIGICFAFTSLGGLIGSPIDGALATNQYIWWRPALFSGLVTLAGSCCLLAMLWIEKRGARRLS